MANTRQDVSASELARMAIAIVDYINKMDKKALSDEINRIHEKDSWGLWFYNRLPAIRSNPEETHLLSQSSLQIAAGVFNSPDFQAASVSAQLLSEFILKSQGQDAVNKLQKGQIDTLHRFVYEKMRFNLNHPEGIIPRQEQLAANPETKKVVINEVVIKEKPQNVVNNYSESIALLASQSVFTQPSTPKKQKYQETYPQKNLHAVTKNKPVKPDVRAAGNIHQPSSFRQ